MTHPAVYARLLALPDALHVRDGDPISQEGVRVPFTPWRIDVFRSRVVLDDSPQVVVRSATRMVEELDGRGRTAEELHKVAHRLIALYRGIPYLDYLAVHEVVSS